MDSSPGKLYPSHPFTLADVETRRKFRMIIALQVVLSLLILLWMVYIATSYASTKSTRIEWTNDWIILVSALLIVVNLASIVITVRKYRGTVYFLKDPSHPPDLILSGDLPSGVTFWKTKKKAVFEKDVECDTK
ncbi:hypothetical protein DL89DRAFT_270227 [Linderina pennispora]|uniref:Uncharacterized protein n=1 Tax=Linderina pennispora TaxID=61395 RepID=A0A1Y1VYG5_9FUNG|nr:uncharacterized protein DL89DRAFT_270227 [Linderina pennispora]ORX66293.1 hypothetical protein DL89DRAFT_270227 [Linderina pennispora]